MTMIGAFSVHKKNPSLLSKIRVYPWWPPARAIHGEKFLVSLSLAPSQLSTSTSSRAGRLSSPGRNRYLMKRKEKRGSGFTVEGEFQQRVFPYQKSKIAFKNSCVHSPPSIVRAVHPTPICRWVAAAAMQTP